MGSKQPRKSPLPAMAEPGGDGATTGYEAQLWCMADALRGSMDAAIEKNLARLGATP